jgi:DNA-binding transcriptional ArsR family regulator
MEDMNVFAITAALADPVRLSVMLYLIRDKASVTEMINNLEVSQSNLSNHLAVLKNANLVKSSSSGRQKIYELANHEVAQLIELLQNMQSLSHQKEKIIKPIQFARTCYDHLAGKFGVALFEALLKEKAIQYTAHSVIKNGNQLLADIEPGLNAAEVFGKLGVDLPALKNTRRRFAFGCTDWTERTPHVAGALGAMVCEVFFEKKWIARKDAARTIVLTKEGKLALKNLIGLDGDRLQELYEL